MEGTEEKQTAVRRRERRKSQRIEKKGRTKKIPQ